MNDGSDTLAGQEQGVPGRVQDDLRQCPTMKRHLGSSRVDVGVERGKQRSSLHG